MKKAFLLFLKSISIITILGIIFVTSTEIYSPWQPAQKIKEEISNDYFALPVGISTVGKTIEQKSYALFPKGINTPKVMFITHNEQGTKVATDHFMFWVVLFFSFWGIYNLVCIFRWVKRKLTT
jgi:hypothetical protein